MFLLFYFWKIRKRHCVNVYFFFSGIRFLSWIVREELEDNVSVLVEVSLLHEPYTFKFKHNNVVENISKLKYNQNIRSDCFFFHQTKSWKLGKVSINYKWRRIDGVYIR